MTKRGAGIIFITISAFLLATKYVTAAIFSFGSTEWSTEIFKYFLEYVGNTLSNFSLLSLIVGIIYIFLGERELNRKKI